MTKQIISVHWPQKKEDIQNFLDSCICPLKKENRKRSTKNREFKESDRVGMLAVDLYSFEDKTYLTIIDMLTRETWVLPVLSKDKSEIELIFTTWFESMGAEFQLKCSKMLSDRGGEFDFEIPGLKRIRSTASHPQTNGTIERRHKELSQQARIHGVYPDQLPAACYAPRVLTNLALRYIPGERRGKSDDPWVFVKEDPSLSAQNKSQTIKATNLDSGRSTVLNKDDYKIVSRPDVSNWNLNPTLLEDAFHELGVPVKEFINPDLNISWKGKAVFVDIYDVAEK